MANGPEDDELPFDFWWELQFWVAAIIGIAIVYFSLAGGNVPSLSIMIGTAAMIAISLSAFRTLMRIAFVRGFVGILVITGTAWFVVYGVDQLMFRPHRYGDPKWETPNLLERFVFVLESLFRWPGLYILSVVGGLAFIWFAVATDLYGARAKKD